MTVLVAPDKFKGSLTAAQVCEAIQAGLSDVAPSAEVTTLPLADGGEGTSDLFLSFTGGHWVSTVVSDPLFRPIDAAYVISNDGATAFIEMARASGLQLLRGVERNPMMTTSLGTGELIANAVRRGAKKIVVGIGGSATNDAGIGMATALGYRFLSGSGTLIPPVGRSLEEIATIEFTPVVPGLMDVSFTFLSDVGNPLFGPNGAAHVFGPQKGASPNDVSLLDKGLRHFHSIIKKQFGIDCDFAGAGAAGGIGAGARAFLRAEARMGFEFIASFTGLEERIRQADVIITGEGKLDSQSQSGKVVKGIAHYCQLHRKQCIVFAGKNELSRKETASMGIEQVIALMDDPITEGDAIRNASALIREKAAGYFRRISGNP